MSRLRILGIGSPWGDDQAGWLVVDALRARGVEAGDDVTIEKLDRPGAHLVSLLDSAAWIILIDAMQSGRPVGSIGHFGPSDWQAYGQGLSSHGMGVLDALALANALGTLPPRLDLYGIEIGSARPGQRPGPAVRAATRKLARLLALGLDRVRPA